MNTITLKSKIIYTKIIISIILFSFILAISSYMLISAFFAENFNLVLFSISILLFIINIIFFIEIYNSGIIIVYNDYIEFRNIFNKIRIKLFYTDIIKWKEEEIKDRRGTISFLDLSLYTSSNKFHIVSNRYKNYTELKNEITSKITENEVFLDEGVLFQQKKIIISAIILIYGLVFFLMARNDLIKSEKYYDLYCKTTEIEGIIANTVKITKGHKSNRYIHLKLEEYPDITFTLAGSEYQKTNKSLFIKNVKKGDSIYLKITINDYLKKIVKNKELDFLEKSINNKFINIYGIYVKPKTYLRIDNIEIYLVEQCQKDALGSIILGFLIMALVLGLSNNIR
ncbi:MAG: hypothetical protein R2801_10995 [Chitinophagales bacterium]